MIFLGIGIYLITVFFACIFMAQLSAPFTSTEKIVAMALIWPVCLLYVVVSFLLSFVSGAVEFLYNGFSELFLDEVKKWR